MNDWSCCPPLDFSRWSWDPAPHNYALYHEKFNNCGVHEEGGQIFSHDLMLLFGRVPLPVVWDERLFWMVPITVLTNFAGFMNVGWAYVNRRPFEGAVGSYCLVTSTLYHIADTVEASHLHPCACRHMQPRAVRPRPDAPARWICDGRLTSRRLCPVRCASAGVRLGRRRGELAPPR